MQVFQLLNPTQLQKFCEFDARVYINVNKHGGERRHHGFVEDGRSVRQCLGGRAPGNDKMHILDYRYRGRVSELWR